MSLGHGASVVRSGLLLQLDAANPKSYPGTGNVWLDLSGNNNHGTLFNGPVFSSEDGGYISFDGTNDYVDCSLIQPSVTEYSIEAWFSSTSTEINNHLVQGRGNAVVGYSGTGLLLSLSNTTTPVGTLSFSANSDNYIRSARTTATTFNDGKWYQAVGVFSQAAGTVISSSSFLIYVNGVLVPTTQGYTLGVDRNSPISGLGGTQIMRLVTTYAEGSISQVRIYNRALSSDEVRQNFEAGRGRYGI